MKTPKREIKEVVQYTSPILDFHREVVVREEAMGLLGVLVLVLFYISFGFVM